jgi:hypothetical protein
LKIFDGIFITLKIIDGISLHISFADIGGSALPTGLSSQATEPWVSALRVSIPAACTLARAGGCKLPTPLRKTPGVVCAGFAAGMDNLQPPKKQSPSRLRRHDSRSNSGLSSPRLRRRDGSFDKSVALHAAPICRKDWKPFVVLALSFANIGSEPPLRRHAGQPGKNAQVTPNRLRRAQATVAVLAFGSALAAPLARFCHALCPRLNARQIVADRVRRLRTDVNHKRKGKS